MSFTFQDYYEEVLAKASTLDDEQLAEYCRDIEVDCMVIEMYESTAEGAYDEM